MLILDIPSEEFFIPETNEFVVIKGRTIQIEHSLLSLSKWESKWKKPFLKKDPNRTLEQTQDYVRCMTLTQNVDPKVYLNLNNQLIEMVNNYINDPHTATTFSKSQEPKKGINRETVTSELIYYWMVTLNIPFECQKWHLNRLLTLIEVCNVKNTPPPKLSKRERAMQWSAENARRRAKLKSKG